VQERHLAEPPIVGVLVHEALALRVDQHAALESPRLRHGQRDRHRVHVQRGRARREPELDAGAIVALRANAHTAASREWRVRLEHAVIVDEATRREHDSVPRAQRPARAERLRHDARDRPVAVLDERAHAVIHCDARAARRHRRDQHAHQERPRLMRHPRYVTARRRHGDVGVRVTLFRARPHQAIVGRRLAAAALVEDRLERHALRDEPRVVLDRSVAVAADLRLVRRAADRRHEVLEHLVG
jgi:hypothetical protein